MDPLALVIVIGLWGLLVVFPFWRILSRAGLSPYWAFLAYVPAVGYLLVEAVLAFAAWPQTANAAPDSRRGAP